MSGRLRCTVAVAWLMLLVHAVGTAQAPLVITTTSLPSIAVGSNVRMKINASGGALPFTFKVSGGNLPPGLKLNATRGVIAGTPTTPGDYNVEITVTDSNIPAMQIQRQFRLVVTASLTIDWKRPPAVHGQSLDGSVIVGNLTKQDFTLTVIVMAVNQIGRATALGYQEFTLKAGTEELIPFDASPGPGSYIVHADAVAEIASTNTIYRARKQTADPLVIQPPE